MKHLLAIFAFFSAAAIPAQAGFVSGSDIAGPMIADEIVRQTAASGARVETDFRGTYDGLRDLRSGRAVAALVFLKNGETLPEVASGVWVAAPVAYQPVYVCVHRANKATEIDLPTLAGLYGVTNDTKFDTWRCLPASGLTQSPFELAPNPGKGLTVSHFRAQVLNGGDFKNTVRFAMNDDDAESRAVSTVNAIVLLPRPPSTGNLKVLAVADGREGGPARAYAPNASNLHSGDYPLRVTLFAVYPKSGAKAAKAAVTAMLSAATVKQLEAKGLLPAPENIRKKFAQSLDS